MARHVIIGEGAPDFAPEYAGQHYIDEAASPPAHYLANGTSSDQDWQDGAAGGGGGGGAWTPQDGEVGVTYTAQQPRELVLVDSPSSGLWTLQTPAAWVDSGPEGLFYEAVLMTNGDGFQPEVEPQSGGSFQLMLTGSVDLDNLPTVTSDYPMVLRLYVRRTGVGNPLVIAEALQIGS
ncbi:MAG: hypothetical protein LAT50_01220 [Ectothiorhodospiraceae bacterium]|nr:hypothetical protein [Ectothiorhodospiraceae bacterium]